MLCFFSVLVILLTYECVAWCSDYPVSGVGCIAEECHAGIEPIRSHDSDMSLQIYKRAEQLGDPNGCVVCHGGNQHETKDKNIKEIARDVALKCLEDFGKQTGELNLIQRAPEKTKEM